jgi:hypothetical protein
MISERKGQTALWGFLVMLVLIAIASGLVDIYRLYAARNWAYTAAQEAALAGASRGRDWSALMAGDEMRLDGATAKAEAERVLIAEIASRGISGYSMDVRILPDAGGGSIAGFPPRPVRLGDSLGAWSSNEPAVGVYLAIPVKWLMLDMLNIQVKTVHVFASAGVAQ